MDSRSIYVVQSKVIPLFALPLNVDFSLRPQFLKIFDSKKCFFDNSTLIYDHYRVKKNDFSKHGPFPLVEAPFIKRIGQVCLNTRLQLFKSAYEKKRFAELLSRKKSYWDGDIKQQSLSGLNYDKKEDTFFGFSPELLDQRMNFLYYEVRPALKVEAYRSGTQAKGKIFIHIYPMGYIVIHLAVSLKGIHSLGEEKLCQNIKQTWPLFDDGEWLWKSKLGVHKLRDLITSIEELICASFSDDPIKMGPGMWHTEVGVVSEDFPRDFATFFFNHQKTNSIAAGPFDTEIMVTSKQFLLYSFANRKNRQTILHTFWKVVSIYEFLLMRNAIVNDYSLFLRRETGELKRLRLSLIENINWGAFRRLLPYKRDIQLLADELDGYVKLLSPYYRRLYSSMSDSLGLTSTRIKFKKLLKDWESECDRWDHPAIKAIKLLFSPLQWLLKVGHN